MITGSLQTFNEDREPMKFGDIVYVLLTLMIGVLRAKRALALRQWLLLDRGVRSIMLLYAPTGFIHFLISAKVRPSSFGNKNL
jgi:hypothetical protein